MCCTSGCWRSRRGWRSTRLSQIVRLRRALRLGCREGCNRQLSREVSCALPGSPTPPPPSSCCSCAGLVSGVFGASSLYYRETLATPSVVRPPPRLCPLERAAVREGPRRPFSDRDERSRHVAHVQRERARRRWGMSINAGMTSSIRSTSRASSPRKAAGTSRAAMKCFEQLEQRRPEPVRIVEHDRFGVQAEAAPGDQFNRLLQGADRARQDGEGVGLVEHADLAFVHGLDDHRLDIRAGRARG